MSIAEMIDHTILKPDATRKDVLARCQEARDYGFASVCINSCWVRTVAEALEGSDVKTGCAVGFPLGAQTKEVKVFEAVDAIKNGANEIDMVVNIGAVKDQDWNTVEEEIREVVEHVRPVVVKVILETCLLTDAEKKKVCQIAEKAGADFVKTSTGFSTGGATVEDVKLMKQSCNLKVKASGGIRTREFAEQLIKAGADRIGTSNGVALLP
ncbi:MAG: deoxyribose-phosphate aldolase [Clostridiales bacterium]|nr:deoxyribose-phosphate aldolase [Clostridiales bacterium]